MAALDLSSRRFGSLVVTGRAENQSGKVRWACTCDCGGQTVVFAWNLTSGAQHRCHSCVAREKPGKPLKHGMSRTRLYKVWADMVRRCTDPKMSNFKHYGAKGIQVCAEWLEFEGFMAWAIPNGYEVHLTIDRRESAGDYEPSNCRWLTKSENSRLSAVDRWAKVQGGAHV